MLLEVVIIPDELIFLTDNISVLFNVKFEDVIPATDVIYPVPVVVILLEVVIRPLEVIFLTKLISPDVKDKLLQVTDEPDVIENTPLVTKPDELI